MNLDEAILCLFEWAVFIGCLELIVLVVFLIFSK
jgi:hypothetical protein